MKLRVIAAYSLLMWGMASCISDDSTLGGLEVPQLSIAGSGDEVMPIFNFNLGEDCVITPSIAYQGGDETDLKYEWSVGTYQNGVKGELEKVSNERVLEHHFGLGGSYYAHLNVTDGKVGRSVDYQININRTFENGYVLVSNDETGNGNLVFVKIMTPEEIAAGMGQIYMDHSLERMNEGFTEKKLVNAIHAAITWPTEIHRVLVAQEDRCLFVDPNTFTILSDLVYEDVIPGFKATRFLEDSYYPCAYDGAMGRFVHMDVQYMFSYEKETFKGQSFDDFFVGKYSMWGSTYVSMLYAKYGTNEVFDTDMNTGYITSTGDLLAGEKLLSAFIGSDPNAYTPPSCILSRSLTEPGKCILRVVNGGFAGIGSEWYPTQVDKTEFAVTDATAVPEQGTKFFLSPTYGRHFYAIGNKVYVCLTSNAKPLPEKTEYAIGYGSNDEVTFMDINVATEELYVATYDKVKKRGSFYIYDAQDVKADNQGQITPKVAHKDCADKITSVLYKPSIQ